MTSDEDKLAAIAATEIERMKRITELGDWDTCGPDEIPGETCADLPPSAKWLNGWWVHAKQVPAHPGRIGGKIAPFVVGMHTTDMLPGEFEALITATKVRPGRGNAYHFCVGVDESQGVVQVAPIDRNANHMGGPGHGWLVDASGKKYHPNLAAVGIEVHCAGGVHRVNGRWRLVEHGKAHGAPLPDGTVIPDVSRKGRGWHRPTRYQFDMLGRLVDDLELVLAPMPKGLHPVSTVELAPAWAKTTNARVVCHVQVDAARRSDPWPPVMDWLRAREKSN